MDDLCIKMIANTRKLKEDAAKALSKDQKPLSTQQVTTLFQILENDILSNPIVNDNFDDFVGFFRSNSCKIIASFEKSISGKSD
jgi:hypothetical protein